MKNKYVKTLITSLVWALVITVLCGSGILRSLELWFCDWLFQRPEALPQDIVIIGIDDKDLEEFGPYYTWDRTIIASALDALAADPDNRPAVVAVDVIFVGTTDPEADQALVDAAAKLGNVVTAVEAHFGTTRTFGTTVEIDSYTVQNFEEPFEALEAVTMQGHINAMYDKDGVLRHSLLYVKPYGDDGEKFYSMAYTVAAAYAEYKGFEISEPPTNDRGQFYVSFTGGPADFYDGISLSELINGEIPPEYFKDKIVFIGPYAPGLQDAYFTPIDRSEMMYGVEYQANVVQAIINGNYKEEPADPAQLIVLFIVCCAFFFFCDNRRLLYTVPTLVVCEAASIGASLFFFNQTPGQVLHAFWIPFGLLVLFVISVSGNYIRAALARQNVTRTFERYVAPNVVNEILKEGVENLKLGGKNVDIAVLFVDVRGFTTMSERLSPETVVYILNQYLTMASNCVEETNGTIDKYVGDCLMAFWGAPLADEDPVYHAAVAGLGIIKGVEEISARLKEEIGEEIHVGVGINYGPAVVGNMGSEKRMDYTAIGDTVNTSARLEANAPASCIYISRSVADKLEGRMRFEPLDKPIKLKGKADGFEILKLLGPVENNDTDKPSKEE